ncbi:hypothetical protein NP233_g12428 [Leucocoprinus birnbaumii]|uniref:Cytochrome P450 n=1 Tax=Leucocoprinus birnbaumii TaxID=56174 RepID=A0AAD5VEN8_9AGAR|nr:hypothetical protein NP233_g12428 [Leucocoprinus birnbaumii]
MDILNAYGVVLLCIATSLHFSLGYFQKKKRPLPPSIPGWPIVGNAFQIPLTYVHRFYKDLGQKLGSKMLYVEAMGHHIVVLNDVQIAVDLLEKRSAIYSSRPRMCMLAEVIGATQFFAILPYGEAWRNHRRIFQQHFSTNITPREQDKALDFIRKSLLPNLFQKPQSFKDHLEGCIGGISLSMTYGLPVLPTSDPLIHKSTTAFAIATSTGSPGKYLVNVLPILKYVPSWFPGAGFKRWAPIAKQIVDDIRDEPYEKAIKMIDEGVAGESFVSCSLDAIQIEEAGKGVDERQVSERYVRQAACQIFGAAAETTIASISTFILAMLKNPEIQRKAQQEVDSVVGSERLPDFLDSDELPYLNAVLKEVLRWNPISPLGVPHATTDDDVYAGFMENGILKTDVLDPFTVATFGFGRRICPGSHIALSILYLAAASILSLFDISPEVDENGKPVDFEPEFTSDSIVSEPLPFPCKILPRKDKSIEELLQEYMGVDVL